MISELLQLADRLNISTPAPFERRVVHYFLDLDEGGQLICISPTCGKTEKGEDILGKAYNCPVFFPLELDKDDETIKATAGGGKAVPELMTGDIMEVFHTRIQTPKGEQPQIETLDESEEISTDEETESEAEGDANTPKTGKNQYYRCKQWRELHERLFSGLEKNGFSTQTHRAVKAFIDRGDALEPYLALFRLPGGEDEESQKARAKSLKLIGGRKFTFRVCGQLMLHDKAILDWWDAEYRNCRDKVAGKLPDGSDAFASTSMSQDIGACKLTSVFPHIAGVPQGGPWCPLASFDKASFQSYGLGKNTTQMTLATAERVAAILNYLLRSETNHFKLSKTVKAVFWAVDSVKTSGTEDVVFVDLMERPDPLQVLEFLRNIQGRAAEPPDTAQFYCALISSPKARITVRSWHTDTLAKVVEKSSTYFSAVTLPVVQSDEPLASRLSELADATVLDSKNSMPLPPTYASLLNTAFFGCPLPDHLLAQVIQRQAVELAKGSGNKKKEKDTLALRLRSRTALIQLYFAMNKKEEPMTAEKHEGENHPAYLCGRLLALLDKIHNEAHDKKSASSPAARYYGAASKTPALVFPQLCTLARYHLEKIGGGWAHNLEHGVPSEKRKDGVNADFEGLAAVVARLKVATACSFPRMLSLEEQGRFAIGFYYERVRKWPKTSDSSITNEDKEN